MNAQLSGVAVPRLRMFAGPNGSGKSTLVQDVQDISLSLTNHFVNADEVEKQIRRDGYFDFSDWNMVPDSETLLAFFTGSKWLQKAGLESQTQSLWVRDNRLYFPDLVNSYLASVLCDFLRRHMVGSSQFGAATIGVILLLKEPHQAAGEDATQLDSARRMLLDEAIGKPFFKERS